VGRNAFFIEQRGRSSERESRAKSSKASREQRVEQQSKQQREEQRTRSNARDAGNEQRAAGSQQEQPTGATIAAAAAAAGAGAWAATGAAAAAAAAAGTKRNNRSSRQKQTSSRQTAQTQCRLYKNHISLLWKVDTKRKEEKLKCLCRLHAFYSGNIIAPVRTGAMYCLRVSQSASQHHRHTYRTRMIRAAGQNPLKFRDTYNGILQKANLISDGQWRRCGRRPDFWFFGFWKPA
jgi:predicted component of type VI protein secretion system